MYCIFLDLNMLVQETYKVSPTVKQSRDEVPDFSPLADKSVKQMDFAKLNNQGVYTCICMCAWMF